MGDNHLAQLSLEDGPSTAIQNLISFHSGLISALQQAEKLAASSGGAPPPAALFQRITGCKRTEAMFYLSTNNNDVRCDCGRVLQQPSGPWLSPTSCRCILHMYLVCIGQRCCLKGSF